MKNERLKKWLANTIAALFAVCIIGFTIKLTYDVMTILFPNDPILKFISIALYDGGVIAWLFSYIARAKGTAQRGISLLLTVLDFIGVATMVIAGIYLGGQTLASIPAWVGRTVVNVTIIAAVINAGAIYYYHATAPDVQEAIQAQELEDTLNEEALDQARRQVEVRAQQLGAIMANRVTARLKYRLRLPMSEQEVREWENESITAEAYDVPQLPYQRKPGFWDFVASFFGKRQSEPQSNTQQPRNSSNSPQEQDITKPLPPLDENGNQ